VGKPHPPVAFLVLGDQASGCHAQLHLAPPMAVYDAPYHGADKIVNYE
jgi:hypothetical protein